MASLDTKIVELQQQVEAQIEQQMKMIDGITDYNQWKVIDAFQRKQVSDYHFAGSTGYAYNDRGREVLDEVYADVFGAEAALVRPHFASGTHTIATALFGVLRPGDELLYITGKPYDTLHKVIGSQGDGTGSLRDFGIGYRETALLADGSVDWDAVKGNITASTKVIGIQRSRGYDWRSSFCIDEIADMVKRVKAIKEDVIVFVDNCYGEFTEKREPTEVGVDLMAGSLIKTLAEALLKPGLHMREGKICTIGSVSFDCTWHRW